MGDSTCVMQSFEHSSQKKGDPLRALGESVSFGRFMTETLEWEKWSTFNQNRYLEEAQRFSKPGLVAQKKALFEAHFKKIAADRAAAALLEASNSATANEVPKHGARNDNLCGPFIDLESGKSNRHSSIASAQNSTCTSSILDHSPTDPLLESQSRETYYDESNDLPAEVSDFGSTNNSDPANFVRIDEPSCDVAVDTSQDLKLCDKMDSLCDTSKFDYMVVEPSPFKKFDPPDDLKTEMEDWNRSELADNSTMLLPVPSKKIAVQFIQKPGDQLILTSPGKDKPTLACSKTLASIKKPAVESHSKPRPHALPRKENNATHSTRAFGSALPNKKRVTTKSLHMSINLDSSNPDSKRPLTTKKMDSTKNPTNSVNRRGSKECPDQIATDTGRQKKLATTSRSFAAIRKSSAELYIRPAPPQPKKNKTIIQRDRAAMINSIDIKKSMPKSHHMSINLGSHVGEMEGHGSLQRTGTKIDASSVRLSKTHSTHTPADQVITDTTTGRKQIIPVSNMSTVGRKLITQFHAKSTPPLYKNSGIQRNSALTLYQIDIKKSLPKSLHMSVDLSSTVGLVRKPTIAQKRRSSGVNAAYVKASRDSSNQMQVSLKKPSQTSSILQFDDTGSRRTKTRLEDTANSMKNTEKCPSHKMELPETPMNLIRPPSPTVSTPFRFRSDERAAKRKEKMEQKYKAESESSLHRKGKEKEENDPRKLHQSINFPVRTMTGEDDKKKQLIGHELKKFPQSRPQSPMHGKKPSPGKARETTNYRPPRIPAASREGGSRQVTGNKTSIVSITCENASPNIKM